MAQTAKSAEFHVPDVAEFYAIHKYPHDKAHKAIAVGPGGHWANSYGGSTAAAASKSALNACNRILRSSKFKKLRSQKCVLFDLDGKRTGNAAPIGIPFGTPAQGKDYPWQFGKYWDPSGVTSRGTMLLLHGCNGYNFHGWQMAWVNYYRAAGFRVIIPNSFAEVRDPARCGGPGEDGMDQQTRIMKLRVAQTLRTIAGIKKKYAGEPLYLHGHSEGGFVAQALGEKVDGIIVTGSRCGFAGFYWVAKGVPVLVIAGTKDRSFPDVTSAKALARSCRNVSGAGKMAWVSVAGMDHYAAIWWPEVEAAISKFLRIPSLKVSRTSEHVFFPNLTARQIEEYRATSKHKAIAVSKDGPWRWDIGRENQLDAEEAALFDCDVAMGVDAYQAPSNKHGCVLVDVNGKRFVK
ncbi:alpha/beta hydrolase [Taklimakanibacter deserti]|uniref:alpha/beta hydrolase n=1 Tax=Taklimakanibacter deserti TaxID=2267839 RepID=UPI0013C4788A